MEISWWSCCDAAWLLTLPAMVGKRPSKKAKPAAFHKKIGRIIKLITLLEILDEQHVQRMCGERKLGKSLGRSKRLSDVDRSGRDQPTAQVNRSP